jgi:transporter family-2 protein
LARHRSIPIVAAFLGGCLSALQSRMNGQLAQAAGDSLEAAVWSFGTGLVLMVFIVILVRPVRDGVRMVPGAVRDGSLRWWEVMGGLLGGYFVAVQSATVPALGVAIFMVAVVAGQSSNSLLVDRVGLGPAGKQPITAARVISAIIAVAAVALAVSDRFASGSLSIVPVLFALSAGLLVAVQSAINGRVARVSQQPMSATFLNFLFGTIALAAAFGATWAFTDVDPSVPSGGSWWMYLGGLVGVVFIAIAAWVVPIVGVLLYALTSIAGQLFGALALDIVAPTSGAAIAWNLVAGVLLAFVAVAVAARRRHRN